MSADKIIARQLAKAAFGWMGTARHLVGPSLCRSNIFCTGGLRASSASLFHFWLIRLMSFQSLDMYFSSCMGRTENVPSLLVGIKSKVLIGSFQKFFNFFQNSVLSLAYRGLFDVHNLRDLTLCFSVLISQRQQEFLVGR